MADVRQTSQIRRRVREACDEAWIGMGAGLAQCRSARGADWAGLGGAASGKARSADRKARREGGIAGALHCSGTRALMEGEGVG